MVILLHTFSVLMGWCACYPGLRPSGWDRDRSGFTYTHERFITALKTQGFTQSFSRIGNCWDNACVESFFGHLKAELGITHQKTTWSYEVAKKTIEEYVEYYRTKRIQARLGYRTPQQVLLDYQASQA